MEDNQPASPAEGVLVACNEVAEAYLQAWAQTREAVVPYGGADAAQRCAALMAACLVDDGYEPGDEVWNLEGMIITASNAVNVDAATLAKLAVDTATAAGLKVQRSASEDAIWQAEEACAERDWSPLPTVAETDAIVAEIIGGDSEGPAAFTVEGEPGLLGDIARWCSGMGYRPVVEFAQPAALATLAAMFGRRYATPTGLGLNLYLVGIAETGGGKDALVSAPRVLLAAAGLRHLIGPGDFTSDAAIEAAIRLRPAQLMCIDEFGKLAQAMTGRVAPAFAKLAAKSLLELYPRSAPSAEWTGKQRAGDARDSASEVIFSPTLSIIGVSTPAGFFEGMTENTLEDGMLNRLTLVVGGRPGARQKDPARLTPPPELIAAIQAACEASSGPGNLAGARVREALAPQAIRCVPWADRSAEAAIEAVEEWEDEARDAGRSGICGRAAEQTQKIATLRALARQPASPAVSADDIAWAWSFVRASIDALEAGAREHMASSVFEELVKAILRVVQGAGPGGIAYSKLLEAKTVGKSEPRQVNAAVDRLKERGTVVVDIGSTARGGRPGKRIRPLYDA